MKKILFAAIALISSGAYAQAASLTIKNMTSDCTANIIVYAESATLGSGMCTDLVTGFSLPAGLNISAPDPYSWQVAYGFGGTITNVCVGPCPSYPSDFQWTFSNIDLVCPCGTDMSSVNVGNTGLSSPSCISNSIYGPGACAGHYIKWAYPSGSLADVVIDIY